MKPYLIDELGVTKAIEKATIKFLDTFENLLKTDSYHDIRRDSHTISVVLKDTKDTKNEYVICRDEYTIWDANDAENTEFYDMEVLKHIPMHRRAPLRQLLRDCVAARKFRLSYVQYRERKADEKLQNELKEKEEILKAQEFLKSKGILKD